MIIIDREQVITKTPEGHHKTIGIRKFENIINPPKLDFVLPSGVKLWLQRGNMFMAVCEIKPGAYRLNWMGRERTLALPYVVLMLPFQYQKHLLTPLTIGLECYYRNAPVTDLNDKLYYPALLNCGHWASLQLTSWMCASRMDLSSIHDTKDNNRRLWLSIAALRNHFFGANFNDEWLYAWKKYLGWEKRDSRIIDVTRWEKETAKYPSFVLGIDWMPAEKNMLATIEYTIGRVAPLFGCSATAYNLETRLINHHYL